MTLDWWYGMRTESTMSSLLGSEELVELVPFPFSNMGMGVMSSLLVDSETGNKSPL